MIGMLELEETH